MSLPRYENYKDSGVEWLGEIPEHWRIIKLKYVVNLKGGSGFPLTEQGNKNLEIPFYKVKHLGLSKNIFCLGESDNFISLKTAKKLGAYVFQRNTIVFAKVGAALLLNRFKFLPQRSCIDNNMMGAYIKINSFSNRFLFYFLNNIKIEYFASLGTIPSINESQVGSIPLTIPMIAEQKRIAEFLDRKCGEIDEAIAKKQRLIELLEEQKTILINQAVTKGLNLNAPMKDSGIEWLGEIPEHWEIKRAKYLLREVDERSQTGQEELLSVSHLTGVTPRSEKNVNMFMAEDYTGSKLCRKNDLVINIMWAWMGALGVSEQLGIVSSSYGIFREINANTFNPWFLEHLLRSKEYVSQYNRVSTGLHSSRLRLYADTFLKIPIIFPPKEEQDQIEAQVKSQLLKINQIIEQTHKQIAKITELKQILIAESVTGKIKV